MKKRFVKKMAKKTRLEFMLFSDKGYGGRKWNQLQAKYNVWRYKLEDEIDKGRLVHKDKTGKLISGSDFIHNACKRKVVLQRTPEHPGSGGQGYGWNAVVWSKWNFQSFRADGILSGRRAARLYRAGKLNFNFPLDKNWWAWSEEDRRVNRRIQQEMEQEMWVN